MRPALGGIYRPVSRCPGCAVAYLVLIHNGAAGEYKLCLPKPIHRARKGPLRQFRSLAGRLQR